MLVRFIVLTLFVKQAYSSVCSSSGISLVANTFTQLVDSPNYPSNYPNNQECLWKISSPIAAIIKLQFSSFKLESGICSENDYVEVRDGSSWSSANPVGVYCGSSVPSTIYSRSSHLLVKFKSDAISQYGGFRASFKRIAPATSCSAYASDSKNNILISASSGTITSPSYPYHYPSNVDCTWKIRLTPPNFAVKLTFNYFNLQKTTSSSCTNDYLEIMDGNRYTVLSAWSMVLGKYCGDSDPGTFYSSGRYLSIRFRTNSVTTSKGFSLRYTSVSLAKTGSCSVKNRANYLTMTGEGGTISSPGYPLNYPNNMDCTWTLTVLSSRHIKLNFYKFRTEGGLCSSNDYVEVRDGRYSNSPVIRVKICGPYLPAPFYSSGRYMRVKFHSDSYSTYSGFIARFQATNEAADYAAVEGFCSPSNTRTQTFTLTKSSGSVRSPGYPFNYPNNMDCIWKITVPSGKRVKLSFTTFSLESTSYCFNDYVELRSGTTSYSSKIGRYCGSSKPSTKYSSGRYMWVKFHSSLITTKPGFLAYYEAAEKSGSSGVAGIVVGVVIAVVVIIALVVFVAWYMKRQRRPIVAHVPANVNTTTVIQQAPAPPGQHQQPPHQTYGNPPPPAYGDLSYGHRNAGPPPQPGAYPPWPQNHYHPQGNYAQPPQGTYSSLPQGIYPPPPQGALSPPIST